MRKKVDFDLNGATISFNPDVSCHTLARRRALRPLTKVLQMDDIQYCWGVSIPFGGQQGW